MSQLNKTRLLIVEDSAIQRELLKRVLLRADYDVVAAVDGVDGFAKAEKHNPSLIISDISMPNMDGYEMCQKIKNTESLSAIPVILLTALSDVREIIRGLQSEADYYITKPYDEKYLLLCIESLLSDVNKGQDDDPEAGLKISFLGEHYTIKTHPRQTLNLLLSTYENAVQKNTELIKAQFELKTLNEELENKVRERTKELQASEESYKVLFENTFSGFYRFTPDGKFLSINPAFTSMLGYSSKDEMLTFCQDLSCQYFKQKDYEKFMEALRNNTSMKDFVCHLKKKDGSELIIEQNIRVVRSDDGEPQYYEGFINDVTECKRAEAQLIKLSSAIIQSPVAVIITDLDGKIDFINPRFCEMTGYSRQEVTGKNPRFLQSGKTPPEVYADLWDTIKSGGTWQGELLNKRKDGNFYWNSITVSPIRDSDGIITHYLSVNEDISNRKEVEETLRKAKEASEVANRAKSEFLANMSHEIRTPMNAIIGMSGLVLDTELQPEQKDYIEIVLNSANSLLTIINSILDFSKIESGKLELEEISFDLRELMENISDPLSISAHKKGLELSSHVKPGVPLKLIGDPARLGQIIINLVGNALKFTETGEIIIEVDTEPGYDTGNSVMMHFTVTDTGIGIPSSKFKYIFENFSQADGSMTRKYGGTGLGLAISKQLVTLMGGEIWLQSTEGKGSTFHFTAKFFHSGVSECIGPLCFNNIRVLVSCNFSTSCNLIRDILSCADNEVTEAQGPDETFKRLEAAKAAGRPYDIAFVDVRLAGVGGFKMAEHIIKTPEAASSVVMMLNSNQRSGDVERCKEIGASSYLIKPIKYKEVIKTMTELVRKPSLDTNIVTEVLKTEPAPAAISALRILLVDDNLTNRVVAKGIMKKHGYSITEAEDGQQAVKILSEGLFDIVLMDVQMPVMDGFEATKIIKSTDSTRHIPVIAMTAHAMKEDRQRCLDAGMDDYITKPVRAAELKEVIERHNPLKRQS
ncbi:response regulator [Candidatus Magnetomonas plexicatena]|uniref:response regulator n=1 Tax=Candidatus Magnetomonas plexicatena TaxID=2552947 RepID=UPI001C78C877|nr:response regulator [Nitrospirales bacterium LBB_01]